jgi:SAM-dependent methyltransferase
VYSADACQTCKTIYQNPSITPDELERYYRSGSYRLEHPPASNSEEDRADRLAMLIDRFKINPKSILDVGCDSGTLLKTLEVEHYAKILGLEYDKEYANIEEMVYRKEDVTDTFDLITCIHVMEHMPNPVEELKWMLSKLNPGGTILLEMPTYLCNDLSHLFVPTQEGIELMLDGLGLDYFYADLGTACNVLIGDRYKDVTAKKVWYTYESPDLDSNDEMLDWLKQTYFTGPDGAKKELT